MLWVLLLCMFSVFIRWYLPARGFLCDDVIAYITRFGKDRKIVIDDSPIVIKSGDVKYEKQQKHIVKKASEGVSLEDINAKKHKDINTNYLYSNFDDSDEDLTSVVSKGIRAK